MDIESILNLKVNPATGTHTATTYVCDLTPGDMIVWNGTLCEVHEAYKAPVGWMLFLSEGIGDVPAIAYRTVQKYI